MELMLKRIHVHGSRGTIGELWYGDQLLCWTLEKSSPSCLPAGVYQVGCGLFHAGNRVDDIHKDCVLVGMSCSLATSNIFECNAALRSIKRLIGSTLFTIRVVDVK